MARSLPIVLIAALLALAAAGCGDDDEDAAAGPATTERPPAQTTEEQPAREREPRPRGATVKVVDSQFGPVVADRRGEALYLFDAESGPRARCYGDCAAAWPPLLTKGEPRAGRGVSQRLLGTTRRRDGKLQVTYKGHPLYYYVDDEPGVILCHGVAEFGGLWLVVNPRGDAVA